MAAVQAALLLLFLHAVSTSYEWKKDLDNDYAPVSSVDEDLYEIPTGFIVGAASSAFQIEGAWNTSGKGPSIWDVFLHARPSLANGDVADDSYNNYLEDVTLVKNTKLDSYRFSLSWSRILPNGTTENINQDGIDYYNNLLDALEENDIIPMVTLYHWDLPEALELKGGWADGGTFIQDAFVDYAKLAFETFGDRVEWWITFNDPRAFCMNSYEESDFLSVSYADPGVAIYNCAHNVLLAHAMAYEAYYDDYASSQGGEVGISLGLTYATPLKKNNKKDQLAADRYMEFFFAWFADPVVFGDYPDTMRTAIDSNSETQGLNVSRLPTFTDDQITLLTASTDFLGLNHFTTVYATPGVPTCALSPSLEEDTAISTSVDDDWSLGPYWSTSTPWGLRGALNWIKDRYNNYPVFITENGYDGDTDEGLNDYNRISLHSTYMRATMRSVNDDSCNVMGYMIWSLLDNLEWTDGYSSRFGLHYVDFTNDNRTRSTKESATFIKNTMTSQMVTYYSYDTS